MKKQLLPILLFCCQVTSAFSQSPQNWTSSDMYLALRKLNVLGSVLYMAAHPDDENTRLIAYFSKEKLYRTGYLSLTRGDGGQNLIGDEQGVELGLIRTQELLAARRIDGGEQFFTRAFDFGYSKSPEETFTKWDKEKILSDAVWVIRKFQPDVIITRFPTTGEGGHGHHTASAILANEAFTAAADPNRFPEQLAYVKPWKVKRILWNTFNFGGTNTITPDQFRIDVGGYNPLLGKSYGEIAAASRSQHKSQGFGVPASRGESFENFKTTGGNAPVNDLMDDVNTTWSRVPGGKKIQAMIDVLIRSFDLVEPAKSVPGLVRLYKSLEQLPDGYWKFQKQKEVQALIEQCSGLFIDATTNDQFVAQTDSLKINVSINNRSGVNAELKRVQLEEFDSSFEQVLEKNRNFNFSKTLYVPPAKPLTQPYWLRDKMEEGYFHVTDQQKIGQADVDPSYRISVVVNIGGEELAFSRPVKYRYTDPVKGEVYQPLVVLPEFEIQQSNDVVKEDSNEVITLNYTVKSNVNLRNAVMWTHVYPEGKDDYFADTLNQINKTQIFNFTKLDNKLAKAYQEMHNSSRSEELQLEFPSKKGNTLFYNYARVISYDHIPTVTYFKTPSFRILSNDIKIYNKKIGYIIGAGDKVPDALEQMGYEVTLLTEKEMARNNLKQFDAIISGVRAYNTNNWLPKYYDRLMQYIFDGGNYIVQYNTNNFISNIRSKIGPFNFEISRNRITDENSPVAFLQPTHPALNFPNKITTDDFKGWIQERSIYHAEKWDKNFEPILSLKDPGENADDGSLIIAPYGRGFFTYTGLVFFRELPAGVPGAYRLLANLIALNKKKGF